MGELKRGVKKGLTVEWLIPKAINIAPLT
jgi:hypothetical protein